MPFPRIFSSRHGHAVVPLVMVLALVAFAATPSSAAAKKVEGASAIAEDGGSGGTPPVDQPVTDSPSPTASASPSGGIGIGSSSPTPVSVTPKPDADSPGYDISYPQCGTSLPQVSAFEIVGVNGGKPFGPNPCLGRGDHPSQLAWAGRDAEFYINTANPGARLSDHWPSGQTSPRPCNTADHPGTDTLSCAYDYGWNFAADAYRTALRAYVSLGWASSDAERTPVANRWWLDVETGNTWRDWSSNLAVLHGAVDYLESMGAESVGFYSTELQWFWITGFSRDFVDYPAWHAGAVTRSDALDACSDPAFTGGELTLTQYFDSGFDANVACPAS